MTDRPPKDRDALLAVLDRLGIETRTVDHPAVHTVEENKALRGDVPGGHFKNLFLKDKKGQLWLVTVLEDRDLDMKDLRRRIGAAHLSFGKADLLMAALGVAPGSVTPFAAINDVDGEVRVVLDQGILAFDRLNFHPLTNTATTAISPDGLIRFLEHTGHPPAVVDLDAPLAS